MCNVVLCPVSLVGNNGKFILRYKAKLMKGELLVDHLVPRPPPWVCVSPKLQVCMHTHAHLYDKYYQRIVFCFFWRLAQKVKMDVKTVVQ